jgi:hypothetical protein
LVRLAIVISYLMPCCAFQYGSIAFNVSAWAWKNALFTPLPATGIMTPGIGIDPCPGPETAPIPIPVGELFKALGTLPDERIPPELDGDFDCSSFGGSAFGGGAIAWGTGLAAGLSLDGLFILAEFLALYDAIFPGAHAW